LRFIYSSPKTLTLIIALLLTLVITLLLLVFPDSSSTNSQTAAPDSSPPSLTQSVQTAEIIGSTGSTQNVKPNRLQLLAVCSGGRSVSADTCRNEFEAAGGALSLGEPVTFVTNISIRHSDLNFSLNRSSDSIARSRIDSAISNLQIGVVHSVRIQLANQPWSNELKFEVSLQVPGEAYVTGLCADLLCAPGSALIAPSDSDAGSFYPFVEYTFGLTNPPTKHMWIELRLDLDNSSLGCLNCQAARTAEFKYPLRKEFGTSGIFYNWDVAELSAGAHSLQARLRNRLYAGPWSSEFVFEVQRP